MSAAVELAWAGAPTIGYAAAVLAIWVVVGLAIGAVDTVTGWLGHRLAPRIDGRPSWAEAALRAVRGAARLRERHPILSMVLTEELLAKVSPKAPAPMRRYLATVADIDRAIGALLDGLDARGLGNATVGFFSDHGEALRDDPRLPINHTQVLYEPLVRIPIALRADGAAARAVDVPISLDESSSTISRPIRASETTSPPSSPPWSPSSRASSPAIRRSRWTGPSKAVPGATSSWRRR